MSLLSRTDHAIECRAPRPSPNGESLKYLRYMVIHSNIQGTFSDLSNKHNNVKAYFHFLFSCYLKNISYYEVLFLLYFIF